MDVTKNKKAKKMVNFNKVFSKPLLVEITFDESAPPKPAPNPAPVCCNKTEIINKIEMITCTVGKIWAIKSISEIITKLNKISNSNLKIIYETQ